MFPRQGKKLKIDIVGTEKFLQFIQEILNKELGFFKTKLNRRYKEREDKIRCLQIYGINQCLKFREWLYKDATLFMKRKKDIFDSY